MAEEYAHVGHVIPIDLVLHMTNHHVGKDGHLYLHYISCSLCGNQFLLNRGWLLYPGIIVSIFYMYGVDYSLGWHNPGEICMVLLIVGTLVTYWWLFCCALMALSVSAPLPQDLCTLALKHGPSSVQAIINMVIWYFHSHVAKGTLVSPHSKVCQTVLAIKVNGHLLVSCLFSSSITYPCFCGSQQGWLFSVARTCLNGKFPLLQQGFGSDKLGLNEIYKNFTVVVAMA